MAKRGDFTGATQKFMSENEGQPDQEDQKAAVQETEKQETEKKPRYSHRRNAADDFQVPPGFVLREEPKSKHLQLLVTPRVFDAIDRQAKKRKMSRNAFVNLILHDYLVKEGLIEE